jgi:hypothetical protein
MAGNATVTLTDGVNLTTYEVWIQMIATSSTNQFASQQVRDAMTWIPIRRSEMIVQFSIVWPLISTSNSIQKGFEDLDPSDGFGKLNKFQDAIMKHQQAMVNGLTTPMTLNYLNNSDQSSPIYNTLISQTPLEPLQFQGWIQQSDKQYIRFQNLFTTQYTMNILTYPSANANTPNTSGVGISSVIYPPTKNDQSQFGQNWLNISTLVNSANSFGLNNMPNGNA